MKGPTYLVKEIFYSLQGEGFWTGLPASFVRFAGCNLKCEFCDTDWTRGERLSALDIYASIKENRSMHVILTGGEPTLQIDHELIYLLKRMGYYIHIETNGTCDKPLLHALDWVTVSPKLNSDWIVKKGDELKVVYVGQDLDQYDGCSFTHRYLQPCSMKNTEEVISICKSDPIWRLSVQTQKLLKIR